MSVLLHSTIPAAMITKPSDSIHMIYYTVLISLLILAESCRENMESLNMATPELFSRNFSHSCPLLGKRNQANFQNCGNI